VCFYFIFLITKWWCISKTTITFGQISVEITKFFWAKNHLHRYSYLPNKRGGSNKRGGWKFSNQLIKREGEKVPYKRGGWTSSGKLIKGEGRTISKIMEFHIVFILKMQKDSLRIKSEVFFIQIHKSIVNFYHYYRSTKDVSYILRT